VLAIVLYEPEIPPNTGNAMRLAANAGAELHLVRPLGFSLDNKQLVRAGLDYTSLQGITLHTDWQACSRHFAGRRLFGVTTRGTTRYDLAEYREDDVLVFGPETRGLPQAVLSALPSGQLLRVPMKPGNRSLNLSNTVAVVVYEAWRQRGFTGGS